MSFRCEPVPGRPGVFVLTKTGEPRVEWDSNGFIATIDDVQYSCVTHFRQALSARLQRLLRGEIPHDYLFIRSPQPELFLSIFDCRDHHLYDFQIREMRKTRQN